MLQSAIYKEAFTTETDCNLTVAYLCYLMEYTQGLETQDFESNLVKGTTHALLCGLSKLLSAITILCSKFTSCCSYDLYWIYFVVVHRAGHHSKQLSSLETMSIATTEVLLLAVN